MNIRDTYKELKLASYLVTPNSLFNILEIPIRNWNYTSVRQVVKSFTDIRDTYKELKLGAETTILPNVKIY